MRFSKIAVFCLSSALLALSLAHSASAESRVGSKLDFVITNSNWQKYRDFMSAGVQALFEGNRFWHMPSELEIEVGPAQTIPEPQTYLESTERYAAQVELSPTAAGGFTVRNYRGGIPFPHPLEGDPRLTGQRLFWDSYYRYQPRVQAAPSITYTLDSAGNATQSSIVQTVLSQLAFVSDAGFPATIPGSGGYYFAKYYEQLAPEQGKYSAILDLAPADPTQLDEEYEYIPTLRRSLRLSEAARCAPVFGSDYLIDDENYGPPGLPQLFKIDYLGEKKILSLVNATAEGFVSPGGSRQLNGDYYYQGDVGFVPFPKPSLGRWELRDTYVISLERLPSAAKDYCYSRRVMYIDKETYFGASELDLYDPAGRLFKAQLVFARAVPISGNGDGATILVAGPSVGFIVDFLNRHVTASVGLISCVNSGCADGGYLDVRRYAAPEALMKMVR